MKKSKKWIALFLAALCTFTPLTAFAADVNIDRKPLQMDVSPTVINGRTMVPMRSIFEGLVPLSNGTTTPEASPRRRRIKPLPSI